MAVNLDQILSDSTRPRRRGRTPAQAHERRREQMYRSSTAQAWAKKALTRLYPDDWHELYRQALVRVNAERGPLPD